MRWAARPVEQRALLNPAFLAVVLRDLSAGYLEEHDRGLPFLLPFLGLPVVLHGPTREILPTSVATSVPAFLTENPEVRVYLPPLAAQLASSVREAIRFAARSGAIHMRSGGELMPAHLKRLRPGVKTEDFADCRDRGRFVGRWFGRAGDPVTLMAAWGVGP